MHTTKRSILFGKKRETAMRLMWGNQIIFEDALETTKRSKNSKDVHSDHF